jgi:formylglycine-generating enzyme required for sulfatase activity
MSEDQGKLQAEVRAIEQAIAIQESLRGRLDDATIEATLAPLRQRMAAILAQVEGSGAIAQGEGATAVGERGIHAPGAAVGGSSVSGQVSAGGHFIGRDLIIVAERVSSDFWRQFQAPKVDLQKATARYLIHLINRYQFLDFKGMGISDRVALRLPLAEMYIPLQARVEMPEGETWTRELRLAGRYMSPEESEAIGHRVSEPQPLLELLQQHDGLIILGDPGAGKTTFLKYLTTRLALGQGDEVGLGNRLPVLLPLSAYANALAEGDVPLARFMAKYYRDLGVDEPLNLMLDEALNRGGALLLLDGLDEVKNLAQRHTVVQRVVDFFAYRQQDGNKFVLTSRIVGYREVRPTATGMAECTLVDFDDEEIELFVTRWTGALERAARGDTNVAVMEAARERAELLNSVRHNPGVRRLAANPLLLTILALMKRQGVVLPERRVELYDKYVETLLKHWNLARGLGRPASRDLDVVETMRVLAPLALWMHQASPGVGLVKREALHRHLETIYTGRQIEESAAAAQQLLADAREYAGLLLERGPAVYGFIHLTFQEYLAAVAIAQRGQGDAAAIADMLAAHVDDDNWREVTLLTIGYIGIRQQLDEVAGQVLVRLIETAPGEPGKAVVLAGEAVADTWPGGVTRACRNQVVESLLATMQAESHVGPQRRVEAGRGLARLGDPRPAVTAADAMPFGYVPAGPFWLGDEGISEDEKPAHQVDIPYAYWLGQYPVTQAQFEEFVAAGGYQDAPYWPEASKAGFWRDDGRFKGRFDSDWRDRPYDLSHPWMLPNHPVVGITWYEALAFCRWLTHRWQEAGKLPPPWQAQLPSEAEWEKGARGGLVVPSEPVIKAMGEGTLIQNPALVANPYPRRRYPWGEAKVTPKRANYEATEIQATSSVGCFPANVSPYGCVEMSGNVWEWTRSHWKRYPYDPQDSREALDAVPDVGRVLRGGAYYSGEEALRCAYRGRNNPRYWIDKNGFRFCVSPFTLPPLGDEGSGLSQATRGSALAR